MITLIAILCSITTPSDCKPFQVTNSDIVNLTMSACMTNVPNLTDWIQRNHPDKRLAGWRCVIGKKAYDI
jgi:hypothetical protein